MTYFDHFDLLVKIIAGLGVIISAIISIWKFLLWPKIIKPFKKWINDINITIDKISKVHMTLGPNGGSSLYDRMTAIDKNTSISMTRGEKLNSIFGIGEFLADPSGHTIKINDVICRVTDRLEKDFLGNNWMNVVHEDDRTRIISEWDNSVKNQRNFDASYRILNINNEPITIFASSKPVYDSNKNLIGFLGYITFINKKDTN